MQAAFLFLDHLLGEDGVERWIGAIELFDGPTGGRTPAELKAEVERHAAEPTGDETWVNGEVTRPDGTVELVIADAALKRIDHPFHDTWVWVQMLWGADRYPTDAEAEQLNQEEDNFLERMGERAILAARVTVPGQPDVAFREPGLREDAPRDRRLGGVAAGLAVARAPPTPAQDRRRPGHDLAVPAGPGHSVIEALFWGGLGASALLVGAVIAFLADVPKRVQGLILAFGAGTLFGAVAYELFEEAVELSVGGIDVAIGFGLGADGLLPRQPRHRPPVTRASPRAWHRSATRGRAASRSCSARSSTGSRSRSSSGCRCSPARGSAWPSSRRSSSRTSRRACPRARTSPMRASSGCASSALWVLVVVVSALAAAIGFGVLGKMGPHVVVLLDSFAAGAILAMLAESMIPEAYEQGGRAVGLATTFGFAIAAALSFQT